MRLLPQGSRPVPTAGWLVPLVIVLIGLGGLGEAQAASFTASSAPAPRRDGHHCRCGDACRGASCCCDHHGSRPHPADEPARSSAVAALPTSASPTPIDAGPCVSAFPCGSSELPAPSVAAPIGKVAALGGCAISVPADRGAFLAPFPPAHRPLRRAERVEKPPKPFPCA